MIMTYSYDNELMKISDKIGSDNFEKIKNDLADLIKENCYFYSDPGENTIETIMRQTW